MISFSCSLSSFLSCPLAGGFCILLVDTGFDVALDLVEEGRNVVVVIGVVVAGSSVDGVRV